MTFVVAEEEADGADEDSAVLAEHLSLVQAVLAALLVHIIPSTPALFPRTTAPVILSLINFDERHGS